MEKEEEAAKKAEEIDDIDMDDFLDDPELEALHAEKLAAMQREAEKRVVLAKKGHGELTTVEEGDFLAAVTESPLVVVHFAHGEFERCKIMDKHLKGLALKYFDTRFMKVSAPDCPFFVTKLKVKMLPCLVLFSNGVAFDRIVGFEELGGKDDFKTETLEKRLLEAAMISAPKLYDDSSDEEAYAVKRSIYGGGKRAGPGESDSDGSDSDY